MFFFLSKLLDVFLSPLIWAILCAAAAIPWRRSRRPTRWRRRRAVGVFGLAMLLVFAMPVVSDAMLHRLERSVASTYRPDATYDAVVLLGGVTDERVMADTGQPSYNDNVERLVMTHRLLAEGRARFAIVSGAPVDPSLDEWSEARVLARQLVAWGIDPSRVIIEDQARNTHENAVYSRRIASERGFGEVLIVTSAFHMRRAAECFEAVGMEVDTLAVDYRAHGGRFRLEGVLPRSGALAESTMTLREVFGLWVYRFQGYAKPRPRARRHPPSAPKSAGSASEPASTPPPPSVPLAPPSVHEHMPP
jgi:uncharacterized SAM-binding protein YcdF (DUF218 family)